MTRTVEVVEELRDLLQEQITDPNKTRRDNGKDFVFVEEPKTNNRYPMITIYQLDSQKNPLSVGSTDRLQQVRIQVSVHVGKKNEFDVDGDDEPEDSTFVKNYLAEECDIVVQDNQDRFQSLGEDIYSLLPDSGNPISPSGTNQANNDYILLRRRG